MKSSFYGKPYEGILIELLRSLFLQALLSEIRLSIIGNDIPLDDIAQKADAIMRKIPNRPEHLILNRLIYNSMKLYLIRNRTCILERSAIP